MKKNITIASTIIFTIIFFMIFMYSAIWTAFFVSLFTIGLPQDLDQATINQYSPLICTEDFTYFIILILFFINSIYLTYKLNKIMNEDFDGAKTIIQFNLTIKIDFILIFIQIIFNVIFFCTNEFNDLFLAYISICTLVPSFLHLLIYVLYKYVIKIIIKSKKGKNNQKQED